VVRDRSREWPPRKQESCKSFALDEGNHVCLATREGTHLSSSRRLPGSMGSAIVRAPSGVVRAHGATRESAPHELTGLRIVELRAQDARDHDDGIALRVIKLRRSVIEPAEVGRVVGGRTAPEKKAEPPTQKYRTPAHEPFPPHPITQMHGQAISHLSLTVAALPSSFTIISPERLGPPSSNFDGQQGDVIMA